MFRGSDLIATGVSSFGHFQGVHYQNLDGIEDYMETVNRGELPINRALRPTVKQMLIRELILLLKEGRVDLSCINKKYNIRVQEEFAAPFRNQQAAGYLTIEGDQLQLTRKGLLQVDSLLPEYFEPQHRAVRYT